MTRVFTPFFRGHHETSLPGIGLGLAIVEKLVSTLGGVLNITSALHRGTRVKVILPMSEEINLAESALLFDEVAGG